MIITMLGPQGSGKGTQGALLAEHLNVPHISAGDMLREIAEHDTDLGHRVKKLISTGQLVDDDTMMDVVADRLSQDDVRDGAVLDGIPRTYEQVELLDAATRVDLAILIHISDEEAFLRTANRWQCPRCANNYNPRVPEMTPKNTGQCDRCKVALIQREDDTPERVAKRLATYHERTARVIATYDMEERLLRVNGMQPIPGVFKELLQKLQEHQAATQTDA